MLAATERIAAYLSLLQPGGEAGVLLWQRLTVRLGAMRFPGGLALAFVLAIPPLDARAQDAAPFDWSGFYAGVHTGGALGLVDVADPFGGSIFGDTVRTPGLLAGGQAGYNWQFGDTVLGFEADVSWADMDGTNTCFAVSGFYISSNCRTHIDALGTVTGRLGWTLPSDGRTLLYGKAGLAWEHFKADATVNGGFGLGRASTSGLDAGWTVGGGVERAVSPSWSLKAEYDFLSFGGQGFTAPASVQQINGAMINTAARATDISQDIHRFKIGMNYHLGGDTSQGDGFLSAFAPGGPAPAPAGTEIEAGVRYVRGWGQFHKDLGLQGMGVSGLASRLTYDGSGTDGAEFFARVDTPFGVVVKGLVGGGSGGGDLNDEDWGLPSPPFAAFVPYSNTLSSIDNDIRYWILDVGYDWWRGAGQRVTPFVGYSYFQQDMTGLGCFQIANGNSDCASPIPTSIVGITEDDEWRAWRLGVAAQFAIAPRLTLAGEAAYLPYVKFSGTDDHVLRSLLSPEDGHGIGVQLEAMLTYAITDALSVGVGGRYWSMWTTSGTTNFGGTGTYIPMRYAAEQAHLLVQGSYKFTSH
jgi:opacity protein-like surface antigen